MKREGRLFPILVSDDNILTAIDTVNKTHRWCKSHRPNQTVKWVERTKPERVEELRRILSEGFVPSTVKIRTIYDKSSGKYRQICEPKLWPDQYVHHALVQVIQPAIMRGMDYWCCGSIPGRGTARGTRGIQRWMREDSKGTKYCAELDIHHFYQTLKPEVVMTQMARIIKDRRVLERVRDTLRDGVPIGHYCSQWYANAVLEPLDHMIREKLGVRHYVRYMDNFTLFGPSKKTLHKAVREIDNWLKAQGMCLKSNWQVFPVKARMPNAMGYRFGRNYMLPRKKSVLRFKRLCRRVRKRMQYGKSPSYAQACSLMSRYGWLKHSNSCRLLTDWLKPLGVGRIKNVIRREAKKRNGKLKTKTADPYYRVGGMIMRKCKEEMYG